MYLKYGFVLVVAATAAWFAFFPRPLGAEGKTAAAKSLRCEFPLNSTGTWNVAGASESAVKASKLILRFDAIKPEEGSAELKNGTVTTPVTLQLNSKNLHFIQAFRSGA